MSLAVVAAAAASRVNRPAVALGLVDADGVEVDLGVVGRVKACIDGRPPVVLADLGRWLPDAVVIPRLTDGGPVLDRHVAPSPGTAATPDGLVDRAAAVAARFAHARGVTATVTVWPDGLPRLGSGKVDRRRLAITPAPADPPGPPPA